MPQDQKTPSRFESILGGLQSGVTLGYDDELAGLSGAVGAKSAGDGASFWDLYRQARDEARAQQAIAQKAHPIMHNVGLGASAALSGPVAAVSKLPLIATLGGLNGLGHSQADLTEGEVGQAALDVGRGAATSGLMAGLMPALANNVAGKVFRSPESQAMARARAGKIFGGDAQILSDKGARMGTVLEGPSAQKILAKKLSRIEEEPLPFMGEMIQPIRGYKP